MLDLDHQAETGCWIVVPVKQLAEAKSRLAPVLAPEQRLKLALQLVEHTFQILHGLLERKAIAGFVAISNDPKVLALTKTYQGYALPESTEPASATIRLNNALSQAVRWCKENFAASALLILPSDLPLLEEDDLASLFNLLKTQTVRPLAVIAPDRHEQGTNALLLRPLDLLDYKFQFGENSFALHLAALRANEEAEVIISRRPGLAFDLDYPEDLTALPPVVKSFLLR
jgi:2-phospho-L-lactate guanylyltransferase